MTQTLHPSNPQSQPQNYPCFDTKKMLCSLHPSNYYVLFCASENCGTPICVDCEEQHSYEHEHANTSQNYVSFSEYVRKQSQFLRTLLEKSKTIKQTINAQIRDHRNECLKVVNDHFDRLQKEANQIEIQSSYIKQIEDNYQRIREGNSCDIEDHIFDENIPEIVDDLGELSLYLQQSIYIKPGIQIVSNEVSEGRRRHHSEKIEYPKAYWVDDSYQNDAKSQGDKTETNIKSSDQLYFLIKGGLREKGKTRSAFVENQKVNKSFEIRDEKPERMCFKCEKPAKKPISPVKGKAAFAHGLIQFRNCQENPEFSLNTS